MRPDEINTSILRQLTRIADSLESIAKSQRAREPQQVTFVEPCEYISPSQSFKSNSKFEASQKNEY